MAKSAIKWAVYFSIRNFHLSEIVSDIGHAIPRACLYSYISGPLSQERVSHGASEDTQAALPARSALVSTCVVSPSLGCAEWVYAAV